MNLKFLHWNPVFLVTYFILDSFILVDFNLPICVLIVLQFEQSNFSHSLSVTKNHMNYE